MAHRSNSALVLVVALMLIGCAGEPGGPGTSPNATNAVDSPPSPSVEPSSVPSGSPPLPSGSAGRPSLDLASPGGPGAATNLGGDSACSAEVVAHPVARLTWQPAAERGDEQLIEVTIFDFGSGRSTFSGSLDPAADRHVFEQLSGQAVHQWRVLTRHGARWTPSEPGQFEGATCVVDVEP